MRSARAVAIIAGFLFMVPVTLAADLPVAPAPRLANFTGEKAKQALMGLMGTRDEAPVCRADIKTFADTPVEVDKKNPKVATWGPFTLDLAERQYRFTVGSPPGPGYWFMDYQGQIELQGGKWVALSPQVTAHGHGK